MKESNKLRLAKAASEIFDSDFIKGDREFIVFGNKEYQILLYYKDGEKLIEIVEIIS